MAKKKSKMSGKKKAQAMAKKRIGTGTARKPQTSISSLKSKNRASIFSRAAARHLQSQALKSDKAMSDAGVSGVGPVASGSMYANALKHTTQGIGPVADGATYARSLSNQKKKFASANTGTLLAGYMGGGEPTPKMQRDDARMILQSGIPLTTEQREKLMKQATMKLDLATHDNRLFKSVPATGPSADTPASDAYKEGMLQKNITPAGLKTPYGVKLASTDLTGMTSLAPKTLASDVGFDRASFEAALKGNYDPEKAGGLNIGGVDAGAMSEEGGKNRRSLTSRALGALDNLTRDAFDFDGLGRSKMPNVMKDAILGGADIASAFKQGAIRQTKDAFNAVMGLNQRATPGDSTAINKEMKNLTQNLGNPDSPFAPINRGIKAFTTDNPDVKGFREVAKDIKDTFTPGAPGLSPREIGGKGSTLVEKYGKNMIAKNLTNIVNEGDKSFGVEPGSTRNIKDAIDYGKNIYKNIKTPGSVSSRASENIARLTGQGTQAPTAGTIIDRFRGRGTGGGRSSAFKGFPLQGSSTPLQRTDLPLIEPIPVAPQTAAPNLQSITQEAYQKRLAQLKQLTPLPPVIQQTRRAVPQFNFRTAFNRDYFS